MRVLALQRSAGNAAVSTLVRAAPILLLQRDLEDDFEEIGKVRAGLDTLDVQDALLRKIIEEIIATKDMSNVKVSYGASDQKSHADRAGDGYIVVVDPTAVTDPVVRQSFIVHELLHVSSDLRYSVNRLEGNKMLNVLAMGGSEHKASRKELAEIKDLNARVDLLYQAIVREKDPLGEEAYAHLMDRIYRMGKQNQEYDTVASELLYYATVQRMDRNLDTYKQIAALAAHAYERRHSGDDEYGEPSQKQPKQRKQGCCFLTTACTSARGLPDDCEELQTLRTFRDGYLRAQPGGEQLIADYYRVAPGLVARIEARHDRDALLDEIYETICDCIALIGDGEDEQALDAYRELVLGLQRRLIGPPSLALTR